MLLNPYQGLTGGKWVRGNLHTHSTRSDGKRSPQAVLNDYASRGYGFLMFSDHDCLMTPAELQGFQNRGLLLIPGNEITSNGPHLLHVNPDRALAPNPQRQQVLNEAATCPGFIIVCHPNWHADFNHCRIEQLREWTGYAGMEIYNGTIGRLDGSQYATDKWDMLLSQGRRIWGFAHDDTHLAEGEVGLGWNMVYTTEPTVGGIVGAMAAGRFYASTGVTITSIQVSGHHVRIETADAQRIIAIQENSRRLAVTDANVLEIDVPEKTKYVRFECWGSGERFAWTQPFFNVLA